MKIKKGNPIIFSAILLTSLLLIGCSEPKYNESEVQNNISKDISISEVDEKAIDSNTIKTEQITLTEIPEFTKISTIPTSTWNEESKKFIWNCSDTEYWNIIKMGESAIPFLISKLKSKTKTAIQVPCWDYPLTEGGLAYILIDEMISIPVFSIFGMQFDSFKFGCPYPSGLLNYMMGDPKNTHKTISLWYNQNKKHIHEIKLLDEDKTDCEKEFDVNSRLRIDD